MSWSATSAMRSTGPEKVTLSGPFTAARATGPDTNSSASSAGSRAASMVPPAGRAPIRAPRVTTNAAAAAGSSTPAAAQAAISPTLCPSTTSGRTP
ncbi:Uncharacterised protein [Mycobacteroides abscessus subsp. abscessus]|nr:Uncharacterised protein [Mycobacteroides abscessus subsp. abscessus]